MKKKKILIIITTEFIPSGGLTTVMMNYYRSIDKNKYDIDFGSTNSYVEPNLMLELNKNNSNYYCLGERKRQVHKYIFNLYFLLKHNDYDIIHINSNSATAAIELGIAKLCSVKQRIVHNHTSKCDHRYVHKILYPIFKKLYTDAISCSKKAGNWIFLDGNFTILNNGIISDNFKFNEVKRNIIRKHLDIGENCTVIGHLGKIYKPKNHLFLIDVFFEYHKLNKNSKLMLVGDGDLRKQVEEKVNQYNIVNNVIFCGMQSNVSDYLSAMDIFLFPSIWEGMPLSVIEAQASGLKCFLSNRIDNAVNVTDSVEFYALEDDAYSWASKIRKMDARVNNRDILSDIYINRIKANNYDSTINVKKLEKIYDRG